MFRENKNILVYGAGSIGSYLAAKLSSAGHSVDVVGRSKAKAIGNTLYINKEKYSFPKVYDDLDPSKKYDYIFVTSKFYDLRRNLETIVHSGVQADLIVLIQNTYIENSWFINLIKRIPFVIISSYDGFNLNKNKLVFTKNTGWFLEDDVLGKDVYNLLKAADVNAQLTDDIDIKRSEKTIFNAAANLICALWDKTFKQLANDKEDLKEMKNVFDETYIVISEIIPLHSKRSLWRSFVTAIKNMDHYSSTYQDVKRNKRTETSFLNGYIIELGRRLDIPTPYNQKLVNEFLRKYPDLY